jgi:Holliday junction resolvase RusA-like endonuclease
MNAAQAVWNIVCEVPVKERRAVKIMVPMVPPSPNELKRKYRNPHAYQRLRNAWRDSMAYSTTIQERTYLQEFAKDTVMWVQLTIYNSRQYDPDNLVGAQKPVLDAMKSLGWIHDDSAKWIELKQPNYIKCSRNLERTEIEIVPKFQHEDAA